jgi:hypothetical protein
MPAKLAGLFRRLLARSAAKQASPFPREEPATATDRRGDRRRPGEGSALLEWIDEEDRERAQIVDLIDWSPAGLGVRTAVSVQPGWPVLVTLPHGEPIKAVVRHRHAEGAGCRLGLRLIRRERRRFDRRPLERNVELIWQGTDGRRESVVGRVRDVSEGGLQFVCEADIPALTTVLVAVEGLQRFGTIADVHSDGDRRAYGVQFSGPPVLQHSADFRD